MKYIITIMLMLFVVMAQAQKTYNYKHIAQPDVRYSEQEKTTAITVAANLAVITVVEGKANPITNTFKVVQLGTAPSGEYNLILDSGDRFYIAPTYAMYYVKEGHATKVWTNSPIGIR